MKHLLFTLSLVALMAGCSAGAMDGSENLQNNCCDNNYNNANNIAASNNPNYTNNVNDTNRTNNTNNTSDATENNHNFILGCKNINDTLIDGTCTRTGFTCDPENECDFGYSCGNTDQCECIDEDICGLTCQTDDNCPDTMRCDMNSFVCKDPLRCTTDDMCDGGMCVQKELNTFVCESTFEGLANGTTCESGLTNDCASGVCHDGQCVSQCRSNSDCADGYLCGQVLLTMGCIPETTCGADCGGEDQFCFNNSCYSNACTEGADCAEGDCVLSLSNPLLGSCGTELDGSYDASFNCLDDEFREGSYTSGTLCMVHQACWNDDECDQGYECWTGDELLISTLGSTGFCGRLL